MISALELQHCYTITCHCPSAFFVRAFYFCKPSRGVWILLELIKYVFSFINIHYFLFAYAFVVIALETVTRSTAAHCGDAVCVPRSTNAGVRCSVNFCLIRDEPLEHAFPQFRSSVDIQFCQFHTFPIPAICCNWSFCDEHPQLNTWTPRVFTVASTRL